jgi:hypothetical protein
MYFEETDTPAKAKTSNLNEQLGQVNLHFIKVNYFFRLITFFRTKLEL